ncbi:hypothetical protein AGMMS49936_11290 [Endomicrobiia bacterium]|nr:hypothetical protein AGMMS49936_11290 [Endomicrobiia bacterium]
MFGNGGVGALGKDVNGDAGAEPDLSQEVSGNVVKDGCDTAGVDVGVDRISLYAGGVGDSKGEVLEGINLGPVSIAEGFGGEGVVGMGVGVAGPAVGGGT